MVNVIPQKSFAHGDLGAMIEGVAREIPEDVAEQLVEVGYVALDVNANGAPDKDQTVPGKRRKTTKATATLNKDD